MSGTDQFSEPTITSVRAGFIKALVRLGIRFRYYTKVLGYYVSSDKRVIKGPGRPRTGPGAAHAQSAHPRQPTGVRS